MRNGKQRITRKKQNIGLPHTDLLKSQRPHTQAIKQEDQGTFKTTCGKSGEPTKTQQAHEVTKESSKGDVQDIGRSNKARQLHSTFNPSGMGETPDIRRCDRSQRILCFSLQGTRRAHYVLPNANTTYSCCSSASSCGRAL